MIEELSHTNYSYLISVIVPIFNVEEYISKCLDSIINNTYNNLQIIVIDDGSTDRSSLIVDEYAKRDKRISVIHQKNQGVSIARNVGLSLATGDYICFIDSDDIVSERYFEFLLKAHIQFNADITICNYIRITNLDKDPPFNDSSLTARQGTLEEVINDRNKRLYIWGRIFTSSFIYGEKYIPDIKFGEDYLYNLSLYAKRPRVCIIENSLYAYVMRSTSAVHTLGTVKGEFEFCNYIYKALTACMNEYLCALLIIEIYKKTLALEYACKFLDTDLDLAEKCINLRSKTQEKLFSNKKIKSIDKFVYYIFSKNIFIYRAFRILNDFSLLTAEKNSNKNSQSK